MNNITKAEIQKSFGKLLDIKDFNQITVKDIIKACDISRSTFYYHFNNIAELVESIIKQKADALIEAHIKIESISDCVKAVAASISTDKKAILNIYHSVNRNFFEKYLWELCDYFITTYRNSLNRDIQISQINPNDASLLTNYMKSICFGAVMCWLDNDLGENMQAEIQRICGIKHGDIKKLIAKIRIKS